MQNAIWNSNCNLPVVSSSQALTRFDETTRAFVPQAQQRADHQQDQRACVSCGRILLAIHDTLRDRRLQPHQNLQKLRIGEQSSYIKQRRATDILITSSGANSIAMGITIFWKA